MNNSISLIDTIELDLKKNLSEWKIEDGSHPIAIYGPLRLIDNGKVVDEFKLRIQLAPDHPAEPPMVFETGGRIERNPDRHINKDGSACLFVADEKSRFWHQSKPLSEFIAGPVMNFFISQSYFEVTGEWIFGERRHGWEGVLDFYCEQFDTKDLKTVEKFLRYAVEGFKGHWPCPCGSGARIRRCHMLLMLKVKGLVPEARIKLLLAEYDKAKAEVAAKRP